MHLVGVQKKKEDLVAMRCDSFSGTRKGGVDAPGVQVVGVLYIIGDAAREAGFGNDIAVLGDRSGLVMGLGQVLGEGR